MTEIFRTVLNMSITGAYIVAAIIILRIAMKKLPKKYSYLLWAILGIRLLCPFSFSSAVSIFNVLVPEKSAITSGQMEFIPNGIEYAAEPRITVSLPPVNNAISEQLPPAEPTASANPMQIAMAVGAFVWTFGTLAMAVYTVISYASVRKRVKNAKPSGGNVYTCESIETPFVFGLIKPRIYLPENLSAEDRPYIIAHEQTHIDRRDYIVKLIAMAALCIHWFNPMVWLSYRLMTKDMELSCDEKALGSFDTDVKKAYANALLNISLKQNKLSLGGVLSFGESNIKSRIKGVLGAKKPKVIAVILAVIAVIAAAVCLLTNAVKKDSDFEPIPNGTYVTDKLLYTAPYKNSYFGDNNGLTYEIKDGTLTISGENMMQTYTLSEPMEIPFTDEKWDSTHNSTEGIGWQDGAKHLSDYKNKYCAEILTDKDGGFDSYIFVMDDELWYVQYGWEIYRLKAADGNTAEKSTQPSDAVKAYLNEKSVSDDDIFTLNIQQDSFFHEAWKYTIPPLSEQYSVSENDNVVEVFAEYRLDGNFVQSYIITAANEDGFRIVDEVNYSPRQFTAEISEVGGNEQTTGYEWQEYVIIPNEDSGIFKANEPAVVYSRPLIGNDFFNVGDNVTVEYSSEPVSDIGLEQPAYFLTMTLNDEPEDVSNDGVTDEPAIHTNSQRISLRHRTMIPDEYGGYNFVENAEIVDVSFDIPDEWSPDGNGLFMLGDVKMLEQNVVYPDSYGLMTEGFLTDMVSGREIQKLDEKYGGESDPYSYYIHTSMEDHDGVYDTHYFVVHQNGYYAVFSFRSGEEFSLSEAEDILKTVTVAPVHTVIDINAMQDISVRMPIGKLNSDGTVEQTALNGTADVSFAMPAEWTPNSSEGYYFGKVFSIENIYTAVGDWDYTALVKDGSAEVSDETTAVDSASEGFDYMVHKISNGTEIYEYIVTRNGLRADIGFYADESLTEEVRSAIVKSIRIERSPTEAIPDADLSKIEFTATYDNTASTAVLTLTNNSDHDIAASDEGIVILESGEYAASIYDGAMYISAGESMEYYRAVSVDAKPAKYRAEVKISFSDAPEKQAVLYAEFEIG